MASNGLWLHSGFTGGVSLSFNAVLSGWRLVVKPGRVVRPTTLLAVQLQITFWKDNNCIPVQSDPIPTAFYKYAYDPTYGKLIWALTVAFLQQLLCPTEPETFFFRIPFESNNL